MFQWTNHGKTWINMQGFLLSPKLIFADGTLILRNQGTEWPLAKQACQDLGMRLAVNPSDEDILAVHTRWESPWAICQIRKIAGAHVPGMSGTFSPPPQVSAPDMHHGTCVTHVPWCISGSLTSGFLWSRRVGKTFPAFPAHAQPIIFTYLVRTPLQCWSHSRSFQKKYPEGAVGYYCVFILMITHFQN